MLYPLLHSIALELLCKAAISNIHPTLVANPKDEGQSIMYALNLPIKKQPTSISAHSLFTRAEQLITDFKDYHKKFCDYFFSLRNEELHSGDTPMSEIKQKHWLPRFYEVANIFCFSMQKELFDLLGKSRAKSAEDLIISYDENEKSSIQKKIDSHKKCV